MAKYSDIKGFTVQTVTSDPAASVVSTGSWATGGSLNSTGHAQSSGSGSYNAALCAGGQGPPSFSPRYIALTEQYNGSSWTEVNDLNAARAMVGGAGTTTAAIATGGTSPASPNSALNESWNGSAWTEVNDLGVGNKQFGMAGTATAAFEVGGNNAITSYVSTHEQWDGTNWTESGDINTGRAWGSAFGTTTAAIYAGGRTPGSTPSGVGNVESWNGSAWTEVNNLNQARYEAASGSGIQTAGMIFAGYQPPNNLAKTEAFDGTSFTEVGDLGTAVRDAVSANNPSQGTSNALNFGGFSTAYTSVTETWTTTPAALFKKTVEGQLFFNSTTNTFKETITDIPSGTWASGTSFPQAVTEKGGAASSNSNGVFGAESPVAATFEYDGTSWTAGGTQNTSRQANYFGTGSSTAAIFAGGSVPPSRTANAETYNGSSFTEVSDLNSARSVLAAGPAGTQTSAIAGTGGTGPGSNDGSVLSESWNGSAWTETADLNTSRRLAGQMGASNTSSLIVGGALTSPGARTANTEVWNGSSWTEVNNLNSARNNLAGAGNVSVGIAFGGNENSPPYSAKTEAWNGTSWSEVNDMSSARQYVKGGGTASSAIVLGGYITGPGASSDLTEEWTADLANKTITAN